MENRSLRQMIWKTIRLELARTDGFPNGSVGRAYLLRLPLDECGRVDLDIYQNHPERATVRRYWPNEPDRNGYLIYRQGGWVFSYAVNDPGDVTPLNLESHPFRLDENLVITEHDGTRLPFRVASCDS